MPKDWLKKLGKGYEGIELDDDGYPTNLRQIDNVELNAEDVADDVKLPTGGSTLSYQDILKEVKDRELEEDKKKHYIKYKEKDNE
jgi:hypothetical protein